MIYNADRRQFHIPVQTGSGLYEVAVSVLPCTPGAPDVAPNGDARGGFYAIAHLALEGMERTQNNAVAPGHASAGAEVWRDTDTKEIVASAYVKPAALIAGGIVVIEDALAQIRRKLADWLRDAQERAGYPE